MISLLVRVYFPRFVECIIHLDAFRSTKNSGFNFRNHSSGEGKNIFQLTLRRLFPTFFLELLTSTDWELLSLLFPKKVDTNFAFENFPKFHTMLLLEFSNFSVRLSCEKEVLSPSRKRRQSLSQRVLCDSVKKILNHSFSLCE